MGVEAGLSQDCGGLSALAFLPPTQSICLCSENYPVFCWEPKFVRGEFGGRESLHKEERSEATPKVGSSVNTGLLEKAQGWPRRHTYPNKLPFLVRKTDSNQLTGD